MFTYNCRQMRSAAIVSHPFCLTFMCSTHFWTLYITQNLLFDEYTYVLAHDNIINTYLGSIPTYTPITSTILILCLFPLKSEHPSSWFNFFYHLQLVVLVVRAEENHWTIAIEILYRSCIQTSATSKGNAWILLMFIRQKSSIYNPRSRRCIYISARTRSAPYSDSFKSNL